jgi:hypothetical protein
MHVRMEDRPHAPKKYERAHARLKWASHKVAWMILRKLNNIC